MEQSVLDKLNNNQNNIEMPEVDNIVQVVQEDIENRNEAVSDTIDLKDSNTSNCLALTIKKEYKLVAIKNVFIHSLKVTWKVIVSTVTLHFLKIFF